MLNLREVNAGDKFGHRTALGEQIRKRVGKKGKLKIYELCRCVCGKEKYVCRDNLFNGKSTNCTCIQYKNNTPALVERNKTHGMTNTRPFRIFQGMLSRCNWKKGHEYHNYGGRGIKVEWNSFEEFWKDMGESYLDHVRKYGEKNTTIDRIDFDLNYCKKNCRWATPKEQGNNRRPNHRITYNGKYYGSMSELARELNVPLSSLHKNMMQCKTLEDAVTRTLKYKGKKFGIL